jgi:ribosomal protein S18 acetylase RimI-like enzyme
MAETVDVTLQAMAADQFGEWRDEAIEAFANDTARSSGQELAVAREAAAALFHELLPDGLDTDSAWLFVVLDPANVTVGRLWLGTVPEDEHCAYVYEIAIVESQRRRGYGRATMLAAERFVRAEGYARLGLTVFGFNVAAQRLYESLGYSVFKTRMVKTLG